MFSWCIGNSRIERKIMSASAAAAAKSSPLANSNAPLSLDVNSMGSVRRRAMVVVDNVENNSRGKFVSDGVNDMTNVNQIHKISGGTTFERSRDLRKGVIASTVPTKRKKSSHRHEKSKWQTVLSILTKNLLLLAVLLYLGQVIWRWTTGAGKDPNFPFAAYHFDGRISEVETSLKKTAKMLQVQLEVVDKKIGSEVGIVTRELTKQIEEKGILFEEELKNLEARADDLSKSLFELKDMDLLSREEFEKFLNELKTRRNLVDSVNLDQIRAMAREIVEKEIEKHAADGLAMVDYALGSGGARVVRHSEPYVVGKSNTWLPVAKVKHSVHSSAQKMLEPSFGEPGQCFPLQGSSGFVEIQLRTGIIPEAVTLEHVSKSVAYDRSSAPKDCRVSGWFEGPEGDPSAQSTKMLVLTEFSYDLEKSNAQTFTIPTAVAGIINMVRLDFTSNHGSSTLTCIYRFRVHGDEPNSPAATAKRP
ncbi:hypothetical protein AXF42_Ash008684 [Apostasia shenzhenica]|uniref:SUN domain-containing protein n=1 Tax=Apostasia shenzhenica TaxID=1088818 RepID=A0A2I0B245_9ASPA|nr:hypothetical protein AXF42_Ash008684 [Apostasia shenzhenica]